MLGVLNLSACEHDLLSLGERSGLRLEVVAAGRGASSSTAFWRTQGGRSRLRLRYHRPIPGDQMKVVLFCGRPGMRL
jgi:hypothetical protein